MDAAHQVLYDLIRVANGKPYVIGSLSHLWQPRRRRGSHRSSLPPSASRTFREIKELAAQVGDAQLVAFIDGFFNEEVRNAFSHSDYVFIQDNFRWLGGELTLSELDSLIRNCFEFYNAFLNTQRAYLTGLARGKRFHKWPNYEVLELLSSHDEVHGFNVHFSNGSKATFTRRDGKVDAVNLSFEVDGQVNFMVGLLDDLEPVYKVNGKPVTDWDELELTGLEHGSESREP